MTTTQLKPRTDTQPTYRTPCGGNIYPHTRTCPFNAQATHVGIMCSCYTPQRFKCQSCYNEWRAAQTIGITRCRRCSRETPVANAYRPL